MKKSRWLRKTNKQINKIREYFKKEISISDYKTQDFSLTNYYNSEILEVIFFITKIQYKRWRGKKR